MKTILSILVISANFLSAQQNMWPLALGNNYQYYSYSTNPFGWSYKLEAKCIIKDTLIIEKRYFAFDSSGNFFRYDNDSNKAFLWYDGIEGLYCDFNLPDGSTFSQFSPFFHTYVDVNISIDSQTIWGVDRKAFLVETARGYDLIYEKFAEHLGIIKKGSGSFGPGPDSETDSWLVNSLLHDSSGDYEYFPNGYLPEISFTPFASIGDSVFITFDIEVNHKYNRTSSSFGILRDGIVYIDSVFVEFIYKKDSIKTSLYRIDAQRIPVTNSYKILLPVDTFLIRTGYELLYRIGAKDKSIIPVYSYSPDSGYYQAVYQPTSIEDESSRIKTFSLSQNYPNPFNPSTKIRYTIPTPPSSSPLVKVRNEVGFVSLKVYDVLGNEVATLVNELKPASSYEIDFNATNLPSGVYFYQLTVGSFIETKKMLLLR